MELAMSGENLSGPAWEKFSKILPCEGICVDKIKGSMVPESVVCQYFGKKSSKSGWKYHKHTTPEKEKLEKEKLEGDIRRARILHSDRLLMLKESKVDVEKLELEESDLKLKLGSSIDAPTVELLQGKIDNVEFKKSFALKSVILSSAVVADCESTIQRVEGLLHQSASRLDIVFSRGISLELVFARMLKQLQRMGEGGGHAFFPRPIANNRETPLSLVHFVNACPVCGFWYSCSNFVSLGCGHTYDPWCLAEYSASGSKTCCMLLCDEFFHLDNCSAIGICPVPIMEDNVVVKAQEPSPLKETTQTIDSALSGVPKVDCTLESRDHPLHATPSSSKENSNPDEIVPASQSSETCNKLSSNGSATDTTVDILLSPCHVCKKKAATVILMDCSHDVFCFGCIQGLVVCPICKVSVKGLARKKSHASVILVLFPGGSIEGGGSENLMLKPSGKGSVTKVPIGAVYESPIDHDVEDSEGNDHNEGLVH